MSKIKYWILDVDGTMTDGSIYYDEKGNELKKFNTRDAAGFFAAREAGMKLVVMTGRECKAVERRMKELKVDCLFQNVKNKKEFLLGFMRQNNISKEELGYIGDELNDLAAMGLAGFVACPANACQEVKERADFVAEAKGGDGVIREVIEMILRESSQWKKVVEKIYHI